MDDSITKTFIEEAQENLEILEHRIISLEQFPDDSDLLNEAFRAIHSLKGGAGLTGFNVIKTFSHKAEDVFETIRIGNLKVTPVVCSLLLEVVDILKIMINNLKCERPEDSDLEIKKVENAMNSIVNPISNIGIAENTSKEINHSEKHVFYLELEYNPEIFKFGIDPRMFFTDLNNFGDIVELELIDDNLLPEIEYNPELLYLSWKLFYESSMNINQITEIFCFVIDESNIVIREATKVKVNGEISFPFTVNDKTVFDLSLIHSQQSCKTENLEKHYNDSVNKITDIHEISYIRVPTAKVENLFNTVSEIIISQARVSMFSENNEDILPDDFINVIDTLKTLTQLLQKQTTSMRMISLNSTFNRFKRIVRDIASDVRKNVKLEISGQDTELDKNMIEKLNDPLKHIIRNCIDHGLETEKERIALQKNPEGLVCLNAYIESGKVVIEISDDGRGINKEKLLLKAIDKGLLSGTEKLSDGEVFNLIFFPGLSTASKVTDLSGRGVGMDAVKTTITALNGTVNVFSEEGEGTLFRFILPLTMAILDGMLVTVGKEKFIIPTLSIIEIFRPKPLHVKTISGINEVVFFRDDYIPIIRLNNIFEISDGEKNPLEGEMVTVMCGGVKAAIFVDNVIDQYQIVLKSLEQNFRRVNNISSATILGNGDIALILDITAIVERKYDNV